MLCGMATIARQIAAEHLLRTALADEGVPAPDAIEYGYTCIRALWFEPKVALVIDLDDPDDPGCETGGSDA